YRRQRRNGAPPPLAVLTYALANDAASPETYTLSLHDALPICRAPPLKRNISCRPRRSLNFRGKAAGSPRSHEGGQRPGWLLRFRSEEHTSELQSLRHLVCRLLLEKKKHSASPNRTLPGRRSTT